MRWLTILLLLLALTPAPAARSAGINLSWDDCGMAGQECRAFACDRNSGEGSLHQLLVSFVTPLRLEQLIGIEGTIDVGVETGALPPWWQLRNEPSIPQLDQCRNGALGLAQDPPEGSAACEDLWQGAAAGGIARYQLGMPTPDRARLRVVFAVRPEEARTVEPDREYMAFRITIDSRMTVGEGACVGCDIGALLLAPQLGLYQPQGVGDYVLAQPEDRQHVYWQGWYNQWRCTPPVATRGGSWGGIKALYR